MKPNPGVLVIDDERAIRRLLRAALEPHAYRVCEAASGQLGLQEAAACRPDVVVLDLGLPDMDGVAVLKRLREWSRAPVLVLSVRDSEDDKVEALDNGADDYLTKPFGTAELLARLRVLLEKRYGLRVDYIAAVDGETLEPVACLRAGVVIALAVFNGATRLIDNTILGDPHHGLPSADESALDSP